MEELKKKNKRDGKRIARYDGRNKRKKIEDDEDERKERKEVRHSSAKNATEEGLCETNHAFSRATSKTHPYSLGRMYQTHF